MALIVADRVRENSTTTGTGTLTLSGSPLGYQTFSSAVGNGNTTYYAISNPGINEWEVGIGTVGAGTLARTTVLASSTGTSLVSFTAGTKDVFCTYPAEVSVFAGNTQTLTNKTISGANNTLSNIGNASLSNSSVTVGSTNIALGATSTTLAGLTSVTSSSFVGPLTGNADTVTNGVYTVGDQTIGGTKTLSNNPVLSAGTANGVVYANGSKVLTTGSALQFDGTKLATTTYMTSTGGFNSGGAQFASADQLFAGQSLNAVGINAAAGYQIIFGAGGSEQMRLTSTGLGIGTSSPGAATKLNVNGRGLFTGGTDDPSDGTASGVSISYDTVNNIGVVASIFTGNTERQLRLRGSLLTFNTGGNTEAMRLDASGNLGLGVTPKGWDAGWSAIDFGGNSIISGNSAMSVALNAYRAGTNWLYKNTAAASNYYQSSGAHQWYTAPSGTAGNLISFTQAMTLDASGRLGIGTASPADELQIYAADNTPRLRFTGAASVASGVQVGMVDGTTGVLTNTENGPFIFGTNSTERMRIDSSGNVGIGTSSPSLRFQVGTRGGMGSDGVFQWGEALTGNNRGFLTWDTNSGIVGAPQNLDFSAGGSNRMRIDSSGNLLVGTTSLLYGSEKVSIYNSSSANQYQACLGLKAAYATGASMVNGVTFMRNDSTVVGYIGWTGSTTTYSTSSDYRLKENIQPMQNALAAVQKLNPVTYKWKESGLNGQGFIAHELQAVVPDCVTGEKDAVDKDGKPVYQGVDTSFLVATLTAAIKELKAELDATKAEVAALKGV